VGGGCVFPCAGSVTRAPDVEGNSGGGPFTGALKRPSPRINAGAPTGGAAATATGEGVHHSEKKKKQIPHPFALRAYGFRMTGGRGVRFARMATSGGCWRIGG